MADWKRLLKKALLADGVIDADEAKLLKREILADDRVDNEEVQFLADLRQSATKVGPAFEKFFFEALGRNILADGVIDAGEVKRLRAVLFADGKIDDGERQFMRLLKRKARKTFPQFDKLFNDCMAS